MNGHHSPIRVLIADDHGVVRAGIRHILEDTPGFLIVAEASNGAEALALAVEHHPDVALLDISMPEGTGLRIAAAIREQCPATRVLMLSMYNNAEYVLESVRAGAHGYLLKDTAAAELRQAVRAVQEGESYFSPPVASRLSAAVRGDAGGILDQLTGREREVLIGIATGRTNREIAALLGISHRTVETHRESLMRKLEIRTVAGLTKFALEQGLIAQ